MTHVDRLEKEARVLSREDQFELAIRLLRGSDRHPFEQEWIEECERRLAAVRRGEMETFSLEEAARFVLAP